MDTEASVVSKTVVSYSTAGLVTKSIVAARDKAPVQPLPRRSIARSIANVRVRISHPVEYILVIHQYMVRGYTVRRRTKGRSFIFATARNETK